MLTLRMLIAAIKNAEIAARGELDDAALEAVALQQAKMRREAAGEFEKAGRMDLVEKEKAELVILEEFLPKAVGREEIEAAAREVIASTGATTQRDIGKVMPVLVKRFGAAADGRTINEIVRSMLQG
jgi:uncharacterized protein YqeY